VAAAGGRWFTLETAVMGVAIGLAFAALFRFWFVSQHLHSAAGADWSHAYLVPLISAYVVWARRGAIVRAGPGAFWPGLLPVALGEVCYVFFTVGAAGNHMLQGFSMVLSLSGVALLLGGARVAPLLAFPIGYLLFGVTISEKIMIYITFQLQLMASAGSYALLNVVGIETEIAGNTLTITNASTGDAIPLNVAEACSGMRMLIGFFALGVAVAFLSCRQWWQRVALVLLAAPVALFTNVLRVASLGVATLFNRNLAAGDAHTFIGVLWLIPGFVIFMGITWALNRMVREGAPADAKGAPA
jgi:exosortase